ncbi:tyrosine-type recombinase/integrase, partial [Staphylococcus felis]
MKSKKIKCFREYKEVKSFEKVKRIVIDYKSAQNLSPNTITNYNKIFASLSTFFDDDVDAFNITYQDARDFITFLQNDKLHYNDKLRNKGELRGIKPSTVNSYIRLCKSIYNVLVELEYIEQNPFSKIKYLKRQNERIKTIPPNDLKKLITSLDKEYYTDFRALLVIHLL